MAGSRWSGTLHLTETYGGYTCPEPSTLNFTVAGNGAISGVQIGEDECTKTHFAVNGPVTDELSAEVFHLKLFAPDGHLDFPLGTPTTVAVRLTGVFTQGTTWIALIHLACTNC
jgi:hypothetical protein